MVKHKGLITDEMEKPPMYIEDVLILQETCLCTMEKRFNIGPSTNAVMPLQSYGLLYGKSNRCNEKATIQASTVPNVTGSKGRTAPNSARNHLKNPWCSRCDWSE